jgi:hypothetical protein
MSKLKQIYFQTKAKMHPCQPALARAGSSGAL